MSDRPDIPSAVKLEVRKACGFGCVLCGAPVFHYDHVIDYAEVKSHDVENLALLCPSHHQDKTSRRISREAVKVARDNPINIKNPTTAPHRWYMAGDEAVFNLGGNVFQYHFSPGKEYFSAIKINDEILFGMRKEGDQLLMDVSLQDQLGNDILRIKQGEITLSTGVGDYDIRGNRITVKNKEMQPVVALNIDGNGVTVNLGEFWREPLGIAIANDSVTTYPGENKFSGCYISGSPIGLFMQGRVYPRSANDRKFIV